MTYSAHDKAVTTLVNATINTANSMPLSVYDRLDFCNGQITSSRTGDSLNIVKRDAEYYFIARKDVASQRRLDSKRAAAKGILMMTAGYNLLKWGSQKLGADKWMQAEKDSPNSPPGGFDWVKRGAIDGMNDEGASKEPVRHHIEEIADRDLVKSG